MQKKIKQQQTGSIMLEVVAVLALMGVMGSMLFRQIYQRNQELHNIQMASEIRTVKEAFSAYIQANRASLIGQCQTQPGLSSGDVVSCYNGDASPSIAAAVCEYLPDGWFGEDMTACQDALPGSYGFQLFAYNDANNRTNIYGIVAPTATTLPSTGWNFRRAARVALLVGADGGAYSGTITAPYVSGSLGSWELPVETINIVQTSGCAVEDCPTYVAMTGIDIFAPEYEAPEGAVGLPKDWDLALRRLHAYNYFSVGGTGTPNCYVIQSDGNKRKYNASENMVYSDNVTSGISACKPLFWVGSDNGEDTEKTVGNVYVQNDLNVGADMTGTGNHALKLTAEGVIKQKDGLTIDKDGRIIARETVSEPIGDLVKDEHFVLDPAYTSTMNDIRLASRGGVRLSDILPNYILKRVDNLKANVVEGTNGVVGLDTDSNSYKVEKPSCPSGYKAAIVVTPYTWNQYFKKDNARVTNQKIPVTIPNTAIAVSGTIPKNTEVKIGTDNKLQDAVNIAASGSTDATGTADLSGLSIDEGICVSIADSASNPGTGSYGNERAYHLSNDFNKYWYVHIAQKNTNGECATTTMETGSPFATAQIFCVWEPSFLDTQAKCEAAGYGWDDTKPTGSKCTNNRKIALMTEGLAVKGAERDQYLCEAAGFKYIPYNSTTGVPGHCQYKYISASAINSLTKITSATGDGSIFNESDADLLKRKAAVCKSAGYKWNIQQSRCE